VSTLAELEERRAYECRLTPDRALETIDEADEFLCDRGLLTRTTDSALPGLFEACHEEPYAHDKPGFGQWPATKFPWFGQLGARGHLVLAVHRGKSLLATDAVAALLDPICRAELARLELEDENWARLLRHLADAGPSELDDLQTELSLTPKELKSIRLPLERTTRVVPTRSHPVGTTRVVRSATSSVPASAQPSSPPSPSSCAGSRGGGTGTTTSWTSSSAPAGSSVSTGTSPPPEVGPLLHSLSQFHRFGEMGLRAHFL